MNIRLIAIEIVLESESLLPNSARLKPLFTSFKEYYEIQRV